jgi:hypothetical protein
MYYNLTADRYEKLKKGNLVLISKPNDGMDPQKVIDHYDRWINYHYYQKQIHGQTQRARYNPY